MLSQKRFAEKKQLQGKKHKLAGERLKKLGMPGVRIGAVSGRSAARRNGRSEEATTAESRYV